MMITSYITGATLADFRDTLPALTEPFRIPRFLSAPLRLTSTCRRINKIISKLAAEHTYDTTTGNDLVEAWTDLERAWSMFEVYRQKETAAPGLVAIQAELFASGWEVSTLSLNPQKVIKYLNESM